MTLSHKKLLLNNHSKILRAVLNRRLSDVRIINLTSLPNHYQSLCRYIKAKDVDLIANSMANIVTGSNYPFDIIDFVRLDILYLLPMRELEPIRALLALAYQQDALIDQLEEPCITALHNGFQEDGIISKHGLNTFTLSELTKQNTQRDKAIEQLKLTQASENFTASTPLWLKDTLNAITKLEDEISKARTALAGSLSSLTVEPGLVWYLQSKIYELIEREDRCCNYDKLITIRRYNDTSFFFEDFSSNDNEGANCHRIKYEELKHAVSYCVWQGACDNASSSQSFACMALESWRKLLGQDELEYALREMAFETEGVKNPAPPIGMHSLPERMGMDGKAIHLVEASIDNIPYPITQELGSITAFDFSNTFNIPKGYCSQDPHTAELETTYINHKKKGQNGNIASKASGVAALTGTVGTGGAVALAATGTASSHATLFIGVTGAGLLLASLLTMGYKYLNKTNQYQEPSQTLSGCGSNEQKWLLGDRNIQAQPAC